MFNFEAIFSCKKQNVLFLFNPIVTKFFLPDIFMWRCCVIRSSVTSVNGSKCNAVAHGCQRSL